MFDRCRGIRRQYDTNAAGQPMEHERHDHSGMRDLRKAGKKRAENKDRQCC